MEKTQALLGKAVICSALRQSLNLSDFKMPLLNGSRKERCHPVAVHAIVACPDVSKLVFTG